MRSTTRSGSSACASAASAVEAGEPLAEVHARDEPTAAAASAEVLAAYELGPEAGPERPLILEVVS